MIEMKDFGEGVVCLRGMGEFGRWEGKSCCAWVMGAPGFVEVPEGRIKASPSVCQTLSKICDAGMIYPTPVPG